MKNYDTESLIMVLFTVLMLALTIIGYVVVLTSPCEELKKLPAQLVRAECFMEATK